MILNNNKMFSIDHDYTRLGALVLILAYLFSALMPVGDGAVLCRRENGYVVVDTDFDGSCRSPMISSEGSGPTEPAEWSSRENCRGPCDDTPLGNQKKLAYLRAKKWSSHTDWPYYSTKANPINYFAFIRKHSPNQPSVSADPVLFALRTVMLLI